MTLAKLATALLVVIDLTLAAPDPGSNVNLGTFQAARRAFSEEEMAIARDALLLRAQDRQEVFAAQFDAAECLRITGSELRTRRQTHRLSGSDEKALKEQQGQWSSQGLIFAERALALAKTDVEIAAAHRVYGELFANSITGMLSGLKNGPKARNHMDEALARTPDDPECQRAIGIMYLNNPPFNGGDVERAIKTFSTCHAGTPDNDTYVVLLAMAHEKNKDWEKALAAAKQALEINPANVNALALVKTLEQRMEGTE